MRAQRLSLGVTLQYKDLIYLASPLNSPSSGPWLSIPAGATAGLLATCITQPFDMIKTRIQLAPKEYRNLWYGGKKIYNVSLSYLNHSNDIGRRYLGLL
jgi:Mitochondrial carrier protein